jgi:acyl-coenzyme A synthetase/AMP-(fatty) acid ligase
VERQVRPYHTNYVVQGRAADAFVAPDGRRVTTWQIDQCLADLPGIAHYQLCERAAGEWLLRFVPDGTPPTTAQTEELRRRLAQLLGGGDGLAVQQTDLLVPESSGKFRLGYPAKKNA